MRPVFSPLVTGWVVGRVDSSVRATALSATDMFDSGGQIVGGPVVGVIGVLATIRIALVAGAAALVPAAGLLVAATRKVRIRNEAAGPTAADTAAPDVGAGVTGRTEALFLGGRAGAGKSSVGYEIHEQLPR
jgi:hypothetical protein